MTNEEIEKKFKFDLDLGLFRPDEAGLITFVGRTSSGIDLIILENLLRNIGFLSSTESVMAGLSTNIRIYSIGKRKGYFCSDRLITMRFNEIPSYIMDYIR